MSLKIIFISRKKEKNTETSFTDFAYLLEYANAWEEQSVSGIRLKPPERSKNVYASFINVGKSVLNAERLALTM